MTTPGSARGRDQLLGVLFIVIMTGLAGFAVAVYDKAFSTTTAVTLRADRVGNQLKSGADVKVRGMVVGTVREVRVRPGGVEVELAIEPDQLPSIPHDVTARLLPKTLFGQRYVSLILPGDRSGRRLADGDVIDQDRTGASIELEKALSDLMPVLQAMQPQKLSSTLGVLAQALHGRGEELGETLKRLKDYVIALNPAMPELQAAFTRLADTAVAYEAAAPDLLDALADMTTTARTVVEKRDGLTALLATGLTASQDVESFLRANKENLISLSARSRPALELLARYSPSFPCLVEAAAALKPKVEKILGAGTGEPGLHVELKVKPAKEGYGARPHPAPPPKGPRCYPVNGVGPSTVPAALPASLPNSPEENRLIAELLAPAVGVEPSDMPGWSGLLMGPLLRGTEVTLS